MHFQALSNSKDLPSQKMTLSFLSCLSREILKSRAHPQLQDFQILSPRYLPLLFMDNPFCPV